VIAEFCKRHQIVILFETQLNLALANALYVPGCDVVGDPAICEFVRNVILGRSLMAYHLSKTSELLTYATEDFFQPPGLLMTLDMLLTRRCLGFVVKCAAIRISQSFVLVPVLA
jgi:hypothetical protein